MPNRAETNATTKSFNYRVDLPGVFSAIQLAVQLKAQQRNYEFLRAQILEPQKFSVRWLYEMFSSRLSSDGNFLSRLSIKTSLQQLNRQPFAFFDLYMSEEEKQQLQSLDLSFPKNNVKSYDNYGDLSNLGLKVESFLYDLCLQKDQAKSLANLIEKITNRIISEFCTESCWITLRPIPPNPLFVMPRWHTDGYMFAPYSGVQYKVAMVFRGAGTLFCNPAEDLKRKFHAIQSKDDIDSFAKNKIKLAKLLALVHKQSPLSSQGAIFKVGDTESAAIHSEPNMLEPRLFFSIVPGTKKQIREMALKQENYNRQGSMVMLKL